jgi:hypothetical protein
LRILLIQVNFVVVALALILKFLLLISLWLFFLYC